MQRRTHCKKGFNIVDALEDSDMEDTCTISMKEKALQTFKSVKTYTVNAFWFAFDACRIYLMWVVLHYLASHLYVYFCAPNTFVGFIYSPFIIAAPHCRALRWVIFNGAISIDNMWLVFGTWICSKLLIPRPPQNT
jgi:hypothetical protein